jgi:hypothetical protein
MKKPHNFKLFCPNCKKIDSTKQKWEFTEENVIFHCGLCESQTTIGITNV